MEKAITNKKIQENYRKRFPDYFIQQAREQNKKIKKTQALYEKNLKKQRESKHYAPINANTQQGAGLLGAIALPIVGAVKGVQAIKTRLSKKKLSTAIKEKEALWKLIK